MTKSQQNFLPKQLRGKSNLFLSRSYLKKNECPIEKLPTDGFRKNKKSRLFITVALITLLVKGTAMAQMAQVVGVVAVGIGVGVAYFMDSKKDKNGSSNKSSGREANQDKTADKVTAVNTSSTAEQISSIPQKSNLNSSEKEQSIFKTANSANTDSSNESNEQTSQATTNSISNKKSDKLPLAWGDPNPLLETLQGKILLKADIGYVYNFNQDFNNNGNSAIGYGASLGWTHTSGFGLSADYLAWTNNGVGDNTRYNANYHIVTITPSYRFSFGENNVWGLRLGLGLGVGYTNTLSNGNNTGSGNGAQFTGAKTANKSGAIVTANNTNNGNNFTPIKTAPIKTSAGAAYSKSGTSDISNGNVSTNSIFSEDITSGTTMFRLNHMVYADANGASSLTYNLGTYLADGWTNPNTLNPYGGIRFNTLNNKFDRNNNLTDLNKLIGYVINDTAKYITGSGNVAKDLWQGVLTSTNANAATAFKNLLTAATATNMEKLTGNELVIIPYAVWNGLDPTGGTGADDDAKKKSKINALDGGRFGGAFFFTDNNGKISIANDWQSRLAGESASLVETMLAATNVVTNTTKLGNKEVAWVAHTVWTRLSGANDAAKKAKFDVLKGGTAQAPTGYIFYANADNKVAKDGTAGIGWKAWANDATYAVEFKNLLTVATVANMEQLGDKDVAWVADAVWQGLDATGGTGADDNAKKKSKIDALKNQTAGQTSYIYYGEVKKADDGAIVGWKTWANDAMKYIEFRNLFTSATTANFEKLNKYGESLSLSALIWASLGVGDKGATQTELNKLINSSGGTATAPETTITLNDVTKTEWTGFVKIASNAANFKTILTNVTATNFEKLSDKDVAWVANAVWQGLDATGGTGADDDAKKKSKIDALKGGTAQAPTGYIFYGQVAKDGAAGTGWKNWANNATYATEFKNLLTAATPANMEKLATNELVIIPNAVWNGLDGADNATKQSQINVLNGGATGGAFFFADNNDKISIANGWQTHLRGTNGNLVKAMLADTGANGVFTNTNKLGVNDVAWVSDTVWKAQDATGGTGADDNAKKKSKFDVLKGNDNGATTGYIYFGQVKKADAAQATILSPVGKL